MNLISLTPLLADPVIRLLGFRLPAGLPQAREIAQHPRNIVPDTNSGPTMKADKHGACCGPQHRQSGAR